MTEEEKIIKINSKWMMRAIKNGEKIQKIRQYPINDISVGDTVLCVNPYYEIFVVIDEIVIKRFCDLTIDDAINDGFRDLQSLKSFLNAIYLDLGAEDNVYLYKFTKKEGDKNE